jgi:prolyl-tRNA editing enzyme YbaK/EbsC (Cys-tRNA(Pro) deacylase)
LDVNHAVRDLMGGLKLSFARPDETVALTGMMIGGVTALALPPGLPIFVDSTLMDQPSVILGSGSRSAKIDVTPEVFRRLPGARLVEGLSTGPPSGDPSLSGETPPTG